MNRKARDSAPYRDSPEYSNAAKAATIIAIQVSMGTLSFFPCTGQTNVTLARSFEQVQRFVIAVSTRTICDPVRLDRRGILFAPTNEVRCAVRVSLRLPSAVRISARSENG
jgi:hypothetical protein